MKQYSKLTLFGLIFGIGRLIFKKLNQINKQLKILTMATQEQFDSIISRIDAATNHLASQIKDLQDEVKAQGLPQDAEDSIVGKLGDLASRLESIGASSTDPLPGTVGSTTPVALGEGTSESNTAPTGVDKASSGTTTQPVINEGNTGQNTPASDGAKVDQGNANATMNPFPQEAKALPGDNVTTLNGDDRSEQIGKQPDASGGDVQTDETAKG